MVGHRSHSNYTLLFNSRDFYYLPVQWLLDAVNPAELDTMDLLMAMNDEEGEIVFSDEEDEAYWTRTDNACMPNIVSHTTYGDYVRDLIRRGWLVDDPKYKGCFELPHWPEFGGLGIIYRPRDYLVNRWPGWLPQLAWGTRAALIALLAKMTEDRKGSPMRGESSLEVTATKNQVRGLAQQLLPAAHVKDKVGGGLQSLASLHLIEEVTASSKNRWYRLRCDAFDCPPTWPLSEIAQICGLDLEIDGPWLELIQAFLQFNHKLVPSSPEIWQTIEKYRRSDPHVATHDDARALLAVVKQRAGRACGPRRMLADFVNQRRLEEQRNWLEGKEFTLSVQRGASVSEDDLMPMASPRRAQATQLLIRFVRTSGLSLAEAETLASATAIHVRQRHTKRVEYLVELAAPLRVNRHRIKEGIVLDCNHLHGWLDCDRPFKVMLECDQPSLKISLRCQFRVLEKPHP